MSYSVFESYQCWHDERINQVINKEAISIDLPNFLATHTPFTKLHYLKTEVEVGPTEGDLLGILKSYSTQNKHALLVVQGVQGAGKSHLIRWLKESYLTFSRKTLPGEEVLLIERAQSNLRGTLQKIIESGVFDEQIMQDYSKKLRQAVSKLSGATLKDDMLDELRNAANQFELPLEQQPPRFVKSRVVSFLQDEKIREFLQQPTGPLDRIIRAIASSQRLGLTENEKGGFVEKDFHFSIAFLNTMRQQGGYKPTQELVDRLRLDEETREDLALYFNRLLGEAIQKITQLSASDLTNMFFDLRRELKQQNKTLTLFIEDITAFTGVDAGIMEVLIKQHTGGDGDNQEYCRLISIIGVTDGYYTNQMADNIKDRLTFHLTLNTNAANTDSALLQEPTDRAGLAARYLNAMRLTEPQLQDWVDAGANPEKLPNACTDCKFRETCHPAFGAVRAELDNGSSDPLGLYPFNAASLENMYGAIERAAHTPRSLLDSVLQYVLQNHTLKIRRGEFPPPPNEVGSAFKAPALNKPSQQRLILNQTSPAISKRLEALVLFWGNRTVDRIEIKDQVLVGGLSEPVFKAFNLPFIEGERLSVKPAGLPPKGPVSPPLPPKPVEPKRVGKYEDDIAQWQRGGQLQYYEDLAKWLYNAINSFLDWESHGISPSQLEQRFGGPGAISIEGQVGRTNPKDLYLARSDELAQVLYALPGLNERQVLEASTYGANIVTVSSWLRRQEGRVVEFVRQPSSDQSEALPLAQLLLMDCVLLEWLQGNLSPKKYTSEVALWKQLFSSCTKSKVEDWQKSIDTQIKVRPSEWSKLMSGLKASNVHECRTELLKLLNRAQGNSSGIKFLDVAIALDGLKTWKQSDWHLPNLPAFGRTEVRAWDTGGRVYTAFQTYWLTVLEASREQVQTYQSKLHEYTVDNSPLAVFEAIGALLKSLQQNKRPYSFVVDANLNANGLSKLEKDLSQLINEADRIGWLLRLSNSYSTLENGRNYQNYFEAFIKLALQEKGQAQKKLTQLETENQTTQAQAQAEADYTRLIEMLNSLVTQEV